MISSILLTAVLQQPQPMTFTVGKQERRAIVVAPTGSKAHPPLVLAFHGHGGTSRNAMRKFAIEKQWPEALVVYPQGIPGVVGITDAEGTKTGWQKRAGDLEDRDLKFVDAILKWARDKYKVDAKHSYVTGHSNGSGFTWLLYSARNSSFAAFAGVCGGGSALAIPAQPKPVFVIGGSKDPIVPLASVRRYAESLKERNGCAEKPESSTNGIDKFSGKQPVWTWYYEGGHAMPEGVGKRVVEFFKSL